MLNKDNLPLGLILGIVIPFIGYAIMLELFDQLSANGLVSDIGFSENFRQRTVALLAVCFNLIPFILYNRRRYANTMRGLIFPTVIYAFIWLFVFGKDLLG